MSLAVQGRRQVHSPRGGPVLSWALSTTRSCWPHTRPTLPSRTIAALHRWPLSASAPGERTPELNDTRHDRRDQRPGDDDSQTGKRRIHPAWNEVIRGVAHVVQRERTRRLRPKPLPVARVEGPPLPKSASLRHIKPTGERSPQPGRDEH